MSPSKKANKRETVKKSKSAQKPKEKTSARSSRVDTRKVQTKTGIFSNSNLWTTLLRAVALLAVIGITVYIYSIRDRVEEFEQFGYAGIFLIALMANATVLLPAPGVAIIYAMGAVFNPFWVGLTAGTGGALGELSGYLAGFSGQAVVERTDIYNRFKPWVDQYGGWTILVLSAIPNPFFDVAGIAAGIAKMPIQTFLLFTWIGQIVKMSMFALAGHYSLEWIENFMH
jgi:uncharacterized membrane protein YdjX (TVP38/TMEM64 family)